MASKEPSWVTQRPADPAYYNAVVRFSKKAPNYTDLARDNALREISTQISVQIDSDIYLKETEANGIPSSEIISQIRSSSRNKLNNIQLYGSYENDKDYWAYYRLSKSDYRAWRMQQRDLAIEQAQKLLSEFDAVTTDAVLGISALLRAMELIVDYTDLDLDTMYKGKQVNLYNELFSRLNRLPESLNPFIERANLAVVAKLRQDHIEPAGIYYEKEGTQHPCKAFPLLFSFSRGEGDIVGKVQTDNYGKAELNIKRITSFASPQQISLTLDKDYWLRSIENPIVKRMFSLLKFPAASLSLLVSRPKAYIDYSFNDSKGTAYQDLLVTKLQDLDLEVVTEKAASNFTFRVVINSQEGEYVSGLRLYSAQSDAYIELLDTQQNKSIYNTNITSIKSTGTTRENAKRSGELSSVSEISDMLLFTMVEQYIMN
ncbi:MAG: LPP20 family lipoprotein [Candidatus Cloacimonetes bacterium]|nr:LPP20 family lipoprotein [Candidatus Cloacimonadota bacterium]